MWQDIRDPATNHLLARIDSKRKLLELVRKKSKHLVDLQPYLQGNGKRPAEARQEPQQDK